jgi:lysophospholipase L1-like esterase
MKANRNCLLVCTLLLISGLAEPQQDGWMATWTASPEPASRGANQPSLSLQDQTVRERLRISIGGAQIRLRLSNEYGSSPLLVGAVTVAVPKDVATIAAGSIQTVTFSGQKSITIPPGAPVLSDPVAFPASYGSEISVSLYFPKRIDSLTLHHLSLRTTVVSLPGDHTHDESIRDGSETRPLILISAVLVPAEPSHRLVVAFGDSIVDGDGASDADRNWPSALVRRLGKAPQALTLAVVNQGIAGNRLLGDGPIPSLGVNALARFDRDALSVPGVTHVVLLEGLNDIGFPGAKLGNLLLADAADSRTPEQLIGAYRQLIARAHARGVKIIGVTLNPCEGVDLPGYYSEAKDATRQAVNAWIRTGGAFDGVIDFDALLRDPDHPSRIQPRFSSDDHLHPNDAGYQAMADAIDLALFK